jgi:cobyrinic acid a,c-diamide synthase
MRCGYPELHASILADNTAMLNDIQQFHLAANTILAECGGFMYCLEKLTDLSKRRYKMLGLLSGDASMRDRGGCQGMQIADLPEGEVCTCIFFPSNPAAIAPLFLPQPNSLQGSEA